ncbi:hypothetical protein BJ138DRAFT_759063 [Hygrophoropsis aurantiaca]|uniref:Uncharacterized protein n=1 Tax=Hygrophoropsis aurantiaca TaxID=72124 RepID=A0ACB7ZW49_9AGAM|nr:hypothetical protein BJ138DRAFT_759063 [Hygrophoropsis aurantiaca]
MCTFELQFLLLCAIITIISRLDTKLIISITTASINHLQTTSIVNPSIMRNQLEDQDIQPVPAFVSGRLCRTGGGSMGRTSNIQDSWDGTGEITNLPGKNSIGQPHLCLLSRTSRITGDNSRSNIVPLD